MKKSISLLLLVMLGLCGCARHYVITLNNGSQVSTASKPKVKGGSYVFKDALGNERSVPMGAVAEIAPASMVKENTTMRFNSSPK